MAWTKDAPAQEVFRSTDAAGAVSVLTVAANGNVSLTKQGTSKGSIQFDNPAAVKDAFQEVGPLLS